MTTTEALAIMLAHVRGLDDVPVREVTNAFDRAAHLMRKHVISLSAAEVRIVIAAWKKAGRPVRVRGKVTK